MTGRGACAAGIPTAERVAGTGECSASLPSYRLKGTASASARARADARPAFVRSEIRSGSNSASAAKMPNTNLPAGVVMSIDAPWPVSTTARPAARRRGPRRAGAWQRRRPSARRATDLCSAIHLPSTPACSRSACCHLNGRLRDSRESAWQARRICHISNPIFYVAQKASQIICVTVPEDRLRCINGPQFSHCRAA